MRRPCLFVFIALIALTGCSAKPDATATPTTATSEAIDHPAPSSAATALSLSDVRVILPVVPGRPAAAYFKLNVGPDARGSLVGITVGHFARAEFHQSKMEGGVMTMDPVDSLPLTPGKPIVFAPGGYHVMLSNGDGLLRPDDHTPVTLMLDTGEKVIASARVIAPGGTDMGPMKM